MPNLRNTVDALPVLLKPEVSALFEKYGVLTAREVHSRYEIYMERYCKDVNTEALTCLTMAKTLILPAASRYQAELAKDAAALKAVGKPAPATLDTISTMVTQLEERIGKLAAAMDHHGGKDVMAEAKNFRDAVLPAMLAIREISDQLEETIADDLWPLPRYREMLFIK